MPERKLFTDLEESERRALRRAYTDGIPVDDPASVGVAQPTLDAMATEGLLVRRTIFRGPKGRRRPWHLWRPTELGREILGITHPLHAAERRADLKERHHRALRIAEMQGIPTDDPASAGVTAATIDVLVVDGLLEIGQTAKGTDTWRPTQRAAALLHEHESHLLAAAGGAGDEDRERAYTDDPAKALYPDAGEAVDDNALAAGRRTAHDREHQRFTELLAARRRSTLDERLRLVLADAARRGFDLIPQDLRPIERSIQRLEDRLYQPPDRLTSE